MRFPEIRPGPALRLAGKTPEAIPCTRKAGMNITARLVQPAALNQVMQANQFGIAGMHRQALVRRAVGMGRTERQSLPDSETTGGKEIDKAQRLPAKLPVPGLPGQRCRVQQYPCPALCQRIVHYSCLWGRLSVKAMRDLAPGCRRFSR